MSQSAYPDWLENWWLKQTAVHLGIEQDTNDLSYLDPLIKDIQQLSDLFTTERPKHFSNYTQTPRSILAYGLFFFPQSFVRTLYVMAELLEFWKWLPQTKDKHPLRILDLGSGLGAVGTAAALMLRQFFPEQPITLHAVDHSSESLQWLKKLWNDGDNANHFKDLQLEASVGNALHFPNLHNDKKYDLIVLGFSFNEIVSALSNEQKLEWLKKLSLLLTPSGILIIIEPALQKTAETLQHISDQWIAMQYGFRWGPYLHQGTCPMLTVNSKTSANKHNTHSKEYWNHEVREWQPPASIEYLNRTLWRHSTQNLKFSFTALSHQQPHILQSSPQLIRLVSPMSLMKTEFLFKGIAADGKLYTYHTAIRGFKKHDLKEFQEQFERGDIVFLEKIEAMKNAAEFRINLPQHIQLRYHTLLRLEN